MIDEVAREPVEQGGAPGLAVHLVRMLDEAAAEEPLPHAIDHRPRQPPVPRIGEDRRRCRASVGQRRGRRRAVQIAKQEPGLGVLPLRDIAAVQLQRRFVREEARQRIRVLQLPLADEAVVAGVALEIDAEKDLRRILRGLHRRRLTGADDAAPVDADEEARGILGRDRIQQARHETVVAQVRFERREQPFRDALARCGFRVVVDAFVVAQQIVPERDPVLRVLVAVGEQRVHQPGALVGRRVGDESLQLARRDTSGGSAAFRAARYAATNRSRGADHCVHTGSGIAGRSSASGASHFGRAAGERRVARAPWSIHDRITAISVAFSGGRRSGMAGSTSPVMRCASRLAALLPGTIAAPLRPPSSASA